MFKWLYIAHENKVFCKREFSLLSFRSSHPEVFLEKSVLKTCSKVTEEQPWQSAISVRGCFCNFIIDLSAELYDSHFGATK